MKKKEKRTIKKIIERKKEKIIREEKVLEVNAKGEVHTSALAGGKTYTPSQGPVFGRPY